MSEFENETETGTEIEEQGESFAEDAQEQETETDQVAEAVQVAEPIQMAEQEKAPEPTEAELDEQLWDKTNKAARLLRNRRSALQKEKEELGGRPSLLVRGLKLLELKPKMTQKEMADLLGVRLHELNEVLEDAEKHDIIARVEPEEPDMRAVVVMADEGSVARAQAYESKGVRFVPNMTTDETKTMLALLDKVIDKLTAMGLDDEREKSGDFKGRGGRNDRDRDRGGRGGFGGRRDDRRDNRGGYRGSNRNDRDRGGRGGFGGRRDDRRDNRGGSFRSNRGNRY